MEAGHGELLLLSVTVALPPIGSLGTQLGLFTYLKSVPSALYGLNDLTGSPQQRGDDSSDIAVTGIKHDSALAF